MAGGPMDLWNHWATQILVLFSLSLQVVLLLLAGIRRRKASSELRPLLWLAYQLADSTAIYAIGHLSLSGAPREHQLVAFWAPFLLLHLGGPDNITAYALEDNKLWLRHLVTLVVQVLGAGYVIYKHVAGSGILVLMAAVLMFVVGVVKYGERTWALRCANFSSIRSSLKVLPRYKHHQHFYTEHQGHLRGAQDVEGEFLLQRAHSLFHICKRGIVDSVIIKADSDDTKEVDSDNPKEVDSDNPKEVDSDNPKEVDLEDILDTKEISDLTKNRERMWTVMAMELSLMYDILYTKANVMHSCFGYCIRVVSPLAIVASLLLFLFSGKDGYSGVDVAISYVLLGGALVLETKSALGALGSSWALAFLCATRWSWLQHAALCGGRWHRLRRAVLSLGRPAMIVVGSSRKWSGTMGQYNMLQFCTRQVGTTSRRLDSLAKVLGLSEWWDRKRYSSTVPIPEEVKKRAREIDSMFLPWDLNTMGLLRHKWGELALDKKRHELFKKLKGWHGVDFHESIITWHIATDLFLSRSQQAKAAAPRVEAITALSNYMMFLLVHRPDMLPGLPQNWLYQQTCNNLVDICRKKLIDPSGRTEEALAGIILDLNLDQKKRTDFSKVPRLTYAVKIAKILLDTEVLANAKVLLRTEEDTAVDVLFDLWTDFLAYAANRCSRESHAKKLNSGGELTTVVWLMIEHLNALRQRLYALRQGRHV